MVQGLPHDIYTIIPYSRPLWLNILLGAVVGIILLGLLYGVVRWYRSRSHKTPIKVTKTPWELLLEELKEWESRADFKTAVEGREFFYGLSLALRKGIELAFGIPATDLTLKEIKSRLRSGQGLDGGMMKELFDFLDRADMIKFADAPTDIHEARQSFQLVKQWLGEIQPRPVQPLPSEVQLAGKSKGFL